MFFILILLERMIKIMIMAMYHGKFPGKFLRKVNIFFIRDYEIGYLTTQVKLNTLVKLMLLISNYLYIVATEFSVVTEC